MNYGLIVVLGGVTLLTLLVVQILIGKRKIKFKGPLHMKVHRWVAYAMVGAAVGHALGGLYALGYLS